MGYYKKDGTSEKHVAYISNDLKSRITAEIIRYVEFFHEKVISVGRFIIRQSNDDNEAAHKICGAAEVIFDGFTGKNKKNARV
jgi:hypothetical protein